MNRWTMMAGLAGLMGWIMPGCGGMAFAQCELSCGRGSPAMAPHEQSERPVAPAGASRQSSAKQGTDQQERPVCPVMGDPVDFTLKTMADDGPVYFCCDMCIPKFKKDPARYTVKVAMQRAALDKRERVQVACPVDGKVVDGLLAAEVSGQKVAFCSKECRVKYDESPSAFKAKLADSYTYQTRCPISGEKIQPTAFADLNSGQRIYFCCAGCGDKLLKDPVKYAPKLEEQGVMIDPKKVAPGAATPKKDDHAGHDHP
ncbi:MAG: hypothetical protein SF069_10980 [Phycisphaerae bacterium]|nr:hypothetical protein [Phycisphaerae bacterium]